MKRLLSVLFLLSLGMNVFAAESGKVYSGPGGASEEKGGEVFVNDEIVKQVKVVCRDKKAVYVSREFCEQFECFNIQLDSEDGEDKKEEVHLISFTSTEFQRFIEVWNTDLNILLINISELSAQELLNIIIIFNFICIGDSKVDYDKVQNALLNYLIDKCLDLPVSEAKELLEKINSSFFNLSKNKKYNGILWGSRGLRPVSLYLEGHTMLVGSVVFSPCGKYVASGSWDRTVRVWNVADGSCKYTLEGHVGFVYSVVFSPCGKYMASGSSDRIVRIWNVADGSCKYTLEGHTDAVNSAVFSPCGKYVASGSSDSTVRIWNVADGSCKYTLEGYTDAVGSVVFSPCGKYVASGSWDRTVRIWNVADGSCKYTLEGHTQLVRSVVFSHCGKYVASGSHDSTVRIWNVADGSCKYTLEGHTTDVVGSVVFSPCGKYVVSGSSDRTVRIWNIADGSCKYTLEGHTGFIRSVVFSPCGKYVVSGSHDSTVRIWNVADGSCKYTLEGHTNYVNSVVFSPCGKYVVSGSHDARLKIYNVAAPKLSGRGQFIFVYLLQHKNRLSELQKIELVSCLKNEDQKKLVEIGLISQTHEEYLAKIHEEYLASLRKRNMAIAVLFIAAGWTANLLSK